MTTRPLSILLMTAVLLLGGAASAQTLRIGLAEDPDLLDPHQARTFVGRIVFAGLCDKLVDIGPDQAIVPQLATAWKWSEDGDALTFELRKGVTFHDGEPFNAEAVKANIERALTLPESRRKSEIAAVKSVEVLGEHAVRLNLSGPFAPLLAQLADRAGMMLSPKAFAALGTRFATGPVCSGPFKFVERVAQDRIVLERFDGYWNRSNIHFEKVTYLPITDATVRLANLQAGGLDLIERVAATDLEGVRKDKRLKLQVVTSQGFQGINFNHGNGPRADGPLGKDARVREAIELAIDRNVINQVVFNGEFQVGNQAVAPDHPYYAKSVPVPSRDVAKAKALLKAAGHDRLAFELMVPNDSQQMQVGQVVQAMLAEAGLDAKIVATEFATSLQKQTQGDFVAFLIGWSGRSDPDGNVYNGTACNSAINDGKYCNPEVDRLLNESRTATDTAKRIAAFTKASEIYLKERPRIYLYHQKWFFAHAAGLTGFVAYPDGMVRLAGMKKS